MTLRPRRVLCLSNGHGEDQVACRVVAEIQSRGVDVIALPIVGEGRAYQSLGISILDVTQIMPSGGFIYQDWRQLWRDLQGGLLALTWRQLRAIRQQPDVDLVLAVGDIVVLLMAWWSQHPYGFVGTAKSDYYWRDESGPYQRGWLPWLQPVSDYLPWERWLMSHSRCRGVFPRDSLTTQSLQHLGIPAFDLGNPMMDGLEPSTDDPLRPWLNPDQPAVLLLPGSRPPEAYRNWRLMMHVVQQLPDDIAIYAAITSTLSKPQLIDLIPHGRHLPLIQGHFGACAHRATVVLAMAGTATEQCVGLGKPVITLPGEGPQFTPAFAEAQTRLLGPSIVLSSLEQGAAQLLTTLKQLTSDPSFYHQFQRNGRRRMGCPGAAPRMADQVCQWLGLEPS